MTAALRYPLNATLINGIEPDPTVDPSIDFETRSTVDLKSAGAQVYAQHPDTDVLCLGWKIGPAEGMWVPGLPIPAALGLAILRGRQIKAWNAGFEIAIWSWIMARRYGWPALPPERFDCTMQRAALVGCPGALERGAVALGLPVRKDMDGHRLMLKMCKPLPVRKGQEHVVRWHDDPEDHLRLQAYCLDDVRTEVMAVAALPSPPPMEAALIRTDRRINLRGIRVDRAAAEGAAKIARIEKRRLNQEMIRLTNGQIGSTNQVAQILQFVQNRGVYMEALRAADVRDFLHDVDENAGGGDLDVTAEQIDALEALGGPTVDPAAVAVLRLRAEAAKASTAKLDALVKGVDGSDRMTDLFAYASAFRTQRWAGRRFQAHNLPRANPPTADEIETERWFETLASGDYAAFCDLLPTHPKTGLRMSVMDGLKSSLRGFLTATTYLRRLVIADLGQIEARGAAWIAGQWDVLDAFRELDAAVARNASEDEIKAKDIYTVTGRKMGSDRQSGKIATLACFAADTKVLILRDGVVTYEAICNVRVTDLTFDGVEWVQHAGVVAKGVQPCMELSGTRLTPDHLIWCGASMGWMPAAAVGSRGNILSRALDTAAASLSSRGISWALEAGSKPSSYSAIAAAPSTGSATTTSRMAALYAATLARNNRASTRDLRNTYTTLRSALISRIVDAFSTALRLSKTDARNRLTPTGRVMAGAASGVGGSTTMVMSASGLQRAAVADLWSAGRQRCWPTSFRFPDGITPVWNWIASTTIGVTNRAISGSLLAERTPVTNVASTVCPQESSNLKPRLPTFDIAYSGPRNRFTILTNDGPLIVHNCGYQGGWSALLVFALVYGIRFTETQAREIVDAWRTANPRIVEAWTREERSAALAMDNPGRVIEMSNGLHSVGAYCFKGGNLLRRLPSGRCLVYRNAQREMMPTPWGQQRLQLTYEGNIFAKGQPGTFVRLKTYGGKLFQNATQAICRDILGAGLIRAERAGLTAVLHVHDEQAVDSPVEATAEHSHLLVRAMTDPIDWVPDLPITSSADVSYRYRKG